MHGKKTHGVAGRLVWEHVCSLTSQCGAGSVLHVTALLRLCLSRALAVPRDGGKSSCFDFSVLSCAEKAVKMSALSSSRSSFGCCSAVQNLPTKALFASEDSHRQHEVSPCLLWDSVLESQQILLKEDVAVHLSLSFHMLVLLPAVVNFCI